MKAVCCSKLFILILFCFTSALLYGNTEKPETTYSKESGYSTEGKIEITFGCPEKILTNVCAYEEWVLKGLKPGEINQDDYVCTLHSMVYNSEKQLFNVKFSFNVMFLKKKVFSVPILLKDIERNKNHEIVSLKLEADKTHSSSKFLEDFSYYLKLTEAQDKKFLEYSGTCKLRGFAEKFFTLRMYRKNVEVYIYKIIDNFYEELRKHSNQELPASENSPF